MTNPSLYRAIASILSHSKAKPDYDEGLREALAQLIAPAYPKKGFSLSTVELDEPRNILRGHYSRDYDEASFNKAMEDPNWDEDAYMNLVEDLLEDPDLLMRLLK